MSDLSELKPGYRPIASSDYELVRPLGSGGFGATWLGWSERRQQLVVCKFCKCSLDRNAMQPLRKKLRLIQQLDHPSIVKLEEEHLDAHTPFLVYEYVDGFDLATLLADRFEGGPLAPAVAAVVVLKIAEAIAYANTRPGRLVHGRLRPQNILIGNYHDLMLLKALNVKPDLRWAKLKVTGFDTGGHFATGRNAKSHDRLLAISPDNSLTQLYTSPQQSRGFSVDSRDDVYSLGMIWYQLLVGQERWGGPRGCGWHSDLQKAGMTERQINVLECCLEHHREDRYPNAARLATWIRREFPDLGEWAALRLSLNYVSREDGGCESESDGLSSLSSEGFGTLATWGGDSIDLNSLATLSESIAKILANWEGARIQLNGIDHLEPTAAKELAGWRGTCLELHGVKTLSLMTAEALANWRPDHFDWEYVVLELGSISELSVPVAKALAKWKGNYLVLDGLRRLGPEQAEALAQWEGTALYLGDLERLDLDTVTALATWKGEKLSLRTPSCLSRQIAEVLARWSGETLILPSLYELRPDTAQALSEWMGQELSLDGISYLSRPAAAALATWGGRSLSLDGLTELPVEIAQAVAGWSMPQDDSSVQLTSYRTRGLFEAIMCSKGRTLSLDSVRRLSLEAAEALTGWQGAVISLRSIAPLSLEYAKLFATWTGWRLRINAAPALTADEVESLLFDAIGHDGYAMVSVLVGHFPLVVNKLNCDGWSPLLVASRNGNFRISQKLIFAGAHVGNITPDSQESALHLAAAAGNPRLVGMLLECGVKPALKNAKSETALQCAVDSGDIDTIRLLFRYLDSGI